MYWNFVEPRTVITELADVFPIEITEAGSGPILDETGNPILDTDNRMVLDEAYA